MKEALTAQWDDVAEEAAASFQLAPLVSAARNHRVLGTLWPFFSVGRLCLSRCSEYPYYVDLVLSLSNDQYVVELTIGQGGWADTAPVRTVSTPKAAVECAASLLPPDYGPARSGTADKWRTAFNDAAKGFRKVRPPSTLENH